MLRFALTSLRRFLPSSRRCFEPKVGLVARRACLRLLRRSAGMADTPADDAEMRLAHRAPEDIRIDLSRAIQSLPDHYREVILMRDIEELSIDEIAGVLGLTRESVKARIHRARLMIREYLIQD